jgi:hypothetical protein
LEVRYVFGKLVRTLGDLGGAEAGLNEDVSALGTEGSSDSLSEGVDTSEESGTALNTELELLYSLLEDNSIIMTSQYHHTL